LKDQAVLKKSSLSEDLTQLRTLHASLSELLSSKHNSVKSYLAKISENVEELNEEAA
jgi:hypothetical protein